ncbi:MAG: SCO family protein, partial [Gaiellaceae bacterium]
LLAALLTGCGGSVAKVSAPVTPPRTFAGSQLTPPRTAPPISLHDAAGTPVTLAAQRGRYVLVTFLYTHCPDVCPLIASNLNVALRLLGPRRDRVRVLAVSVDPRGDTRASVVRFVREHRLLPQFRYLTGSRAQLRPVWAAYHLAVAASPALVDHTAYTLLVDPQGRGRAIYDAQQGGAAVAADVRALLSPA